MGFQELALLLLLFLPLCSAQSTYYVTPTPDTPCPGQPCHSFPAVVDSLTSDTILVFLPGNYSLETNITFAGLDSLTLSGNSTSLPQVTISILCSQDAGMVFTDISELFIADIAFVSCGSPYTASVQLEHNSQASITNCMIQGGQNGALSVINSNVHLSKSKFNNNSARYSAGGALAIESSHINMSGNSFTNNFATSTFGSGGGVYMNDSTANISGNIFINNSASVFGGGVYLEDSKVHFASNTFKNNKIRFCCSIHCGGGALAIQSSNIEILGNLFANNVDNNTECNGGGIYMKNSNADIRGTMFINNSAGTWGGGVYLKTSTVNFSNNLFENNTAQYGGGIEAEDNSSVIASNNTFSRNIARVGGGGIDVFSEVVANFTGNIFEQNTAVEFGGGIYLSNATVNFSNNLVENNTAGQGGGGIEVLNNSNVIATTNIFTRNFAGVGGGGIKIFISVIANLTSNSFEYNSAGVSGGGVFSVNSTVRFSNNMFKNNTAQYGGGIKAFHHGIVIATNNTFTRNIASVSGGGIVILARVIANFTGNIFEYNSAVEFGGGAALEDSTVSFNSNLFTSNTARFGGGMGIYGKSNVSATNNIFTSNSAGVGGGGIDTEIGVVAKFMGNSFEYNNAGQSGGGVFSVNSTVRFSNNMFKNNTAQYGGGIVAFHYDNVIATNNTFTRNIASVSGGGIVILARVIANFTGNIFEYNSAVGWGGGATLEDSTVSFNSNLLMNNTAGVVGGGIEVYRNSIVSATNNTFTRNSAVSGGGIDTRIGVVANFTGNIFEYNSAVGLGGGVALEDSTVSFNSNLFLSNTAGVVGGGIEVYRNSIVSATNNTFTRNSAVAGGGIDTRIGVVANFMGNIFEYNTAGKFGGGVYFTNATVSFNNNLVTNNSASFGGGMGAFNSSNVRANNNIFTKNVAGVNGGGIIIFVGVVAKFMGNIFDHNIAQSRGGGVWVLWYSTVSFTLDSFICNSVVDIGGGLLVADSIINISESNLTGNVAGVRGGGTYVLSGTVNIHDTMFVNNSASLNGAGIYSASGTNSFECINNIFRNNWGGGWVLFIEDSNRTSALLSQNAYENNTGNVVYGSSEETPSIYHITPSLGTLCPNESCLTISEFIDQAGQYIALNTTLMFLPGTHTVRSGLLVEDIDSLTLLGDSSAGLLPLIKCDRPASFGFKQIDELLVRFLAFDSCGDGTYAAINMKSVSNIEISECSFKNSIRNGGAVVVANCNMLFIINSIFENNSASVGGGLYTTKSTMNFTGNTFTNNIATLRGAGVAHLDSNATYTGTVIFRNNSGVSSGREIVNNDREFREGILSQANVGTKSTGGAMFISGSFVAFENINIENNVATYGGGVCILRSTIVFNGSTDIVDNRADVSGGGVYAVDRSLLHFEGTSTFEDNSALNGGGLYLADNSLCYFSATAQQYYLQNYASDTGGAIYVADTTPSVYCDENSASEGLRSLCFFQITVPIQNRLSSLSLDIMSIVFKTDFQNKIYFYNNTAIVEGGDLYGGTIDNCKLPSITICPNFCDFQSSGDVFNTMTTGDLDISSAPVKVCSCEQQTPDCSQPSSIELYPGEKFNVFVTVIGQRNATVPTVIQTQLSENIKIYELQNTQRTHGSQLCSELSFMVFSAESESGNLTLSIDSPCDQNALTIQINMQECPHGFQLSTSTNTCICDERLTEKLLKSTERCDIETGIVRPNGATFWVGYDTDSDSLILHPQCPFDYCTEVELIVQVDDSDTQCSYNRTGKLCGGCSGTTSLVLGSSRCIQCSNSYLALIIPFAVAGIALVVFLFILKLTVAVGTINGLIFYANLVQVNSLIFFRSMNTNILTGFISWLNLDVGIETCFYDGMDIYAKTWLQFVFPVYVWSLVGVIILISHFSRKITTLLGSNPIAVLATLFLLSYTKILRTIIATFSFRYLRYPDGYASVWAYDGNIEYLSGKHTPLFITALLSLILLFLPFTLLLFLGQWLQMIQAKTEWRILSWINKPTFRTFLDAYHAPYASSHRYWTGLLLWVRCILFVIIASPSAGDSRADLFAVSSAVVGLITFALATGIYHNRYFGILEASFFLNLVLLATATNYIQAAGGNQAAVTLISLSVAFTTFAGIVIYHIFLQIRGTKMWLRVSSIYKSRFSKQSNNIEEEIESHEASITTTYVELREPLLDDK